jgi:hypothetical protein
VELVESGSGFGIGTYRTWFGVGEAGALRVSCPYGRTALQGLVVLRLCGGVMAVGFDTPLRDPLLVLSLQADGHENQQHRHADHG